MYKEKGGGHTIVLAAYFHGLFAAKKSGKKPIPSCHPQRRDVSFPSSRWCEL